MSERNGAMFAYVFKTKDGTTGSGRNWAYGRIRSHKDVVTLEKETKELKGWESVAITFFANFERPEEDEK
jgi:hypothetical protein